MSCQPCGCDPEARHHCGDYPHCAWGRVEAREVHTSPTPEGVQAVVGASPKWETVQPKRGTGESTSMTLQQFQSSIARTYKPSNPACHGLGIAGEASEVLELILAVTGINITDMTEAQRTQCRAAFTAAGRVSDIVKKELFHKTGVNLLTSERRDDMRKELGDVLWYVAAVASDWGFTLDEVAQGNIDKLAKRYPNGFEKGGGKREPTPQEVLSELKEVVAPRKPRELDSDDVMLFAGQPFDTTKPAKVIVGGISREIGAGVRIEGDDTTLSMARTIRLPKNTFRAIRRAFDLGNAGRRFTTDMPVYHGRQTFAVCASVFEEGDE